MRILLDTCTFLWLISDAAPLSQTARTSIRNRDNRVYLSVVSAWEIAVKHALDRLPLPEPPEQFVPRMRTAHELELLPLGEPEALRVARLEFHHRDPFDRMLVSQAAVHDLTVLTPDPLIRRYPIATQW